MQRGSGSCFFWKVHFILLKFFEKRKKTTEKKSLPPSSIFLQNWPANQDIFFVWPKANSYNKINNYIIIWLILIVKWILYPHIIYSRQKFWYTVMTCSCTIFRLWSMKISLHPQPSLFPIKLNVYNINEVKKKTWIHTFYT